MIVSIPKWMITTSRRQGRFREERSEGSPSAKLRAYDKITGSDFEHPENGREAVSPRDGVNSRQNRLERF